MKDVTDIDEFEIKKIELTNEDGLKLYSKSNIIKYNDISNTEHNSVEFKKSIFVNDQDNIVDKRDNEYLSETCLNEFRIKHEINVPAIKEETLKTTKEESLIDEKEFLTTTKNKVIKDVAEIDEFEIKKIELTDENGVILSSKSNIIKYNDISNTEHNSVEFK